MKFLPKKYLSVYKKISFQRVSKTTHKLIKGIKLTQTKRVLTKLFSPFNIRYTKKIFPFALGSLFILIPALYLVLKNPKPIYAAPWAQPAGQWGSRKQITLVNNSGNTLNSGSTYSISLDTKSLYDAGTIKSDCSDLRVYYQLADTTSSEIYRHTMPANGTTCATSTSTKIAFPLQASMSNAATDSNYYIYYNNIDAPAYSDSDALKAYNVGAKQATFVAPFNGTTQALAAGSGTPTTATGAIRYSVGKSALNFDGLGDHVQGVNLGNIWSGDFTLEGWVKTSRVCGAGETFYLNTFPINGKAVSIYCASGSYRMWFWQTLSPTSIDYRGIVNMTPDVWHHVVYTFINTTKSVRMFFDGSEVTTQTATSGSGTLPTTFSYQVSSGDTSAWNGQIDEVRISNVARYTSTFTPQTTPFVRDEYTKLLLHFDENGDDPRYSGKAIDDSGNGNNGTITGAKYVDGVVGIDNSATATGYQTNQSYASHNGIFIEEGTTNKVTNPSFENATAYDTNWSGGNSFSYANASKTFTPNIAKRKPSSGPFAQGAMVQGKADASGTPDIVSLSSGTVIADMFSSNQDNNQGTVVFWITPEWNGNDGQQRFFYHGSIANGHIAVSKTTANKLNLTILGLADLGVDISSWTAGSTYCVIMRWDRWKTLDGTNYASVTVDNTTTFGITSKPGSGYSYGRDYIGYYQTASATAPAGAVIQGLTRYRRVLYDGTYGVDVGNGNELSQIYNSGTGTDPTQITGSWDVVFALPTNASTGTLGTTGEAWSHPHTSNVENQWYAGDGYYGGGPWGLTIGTGSNVNYGSNSSLDDIHSGAFTAEAWFNISAESGYKYVLTKDYYGQEGWKFGFYEGYWYAELKASTTNASSRIAETSLPNLWGKWHHLAITYDNNGTRKIRMFYDGTEVTYQVQTAAVGTINTDAANNLVTNELGNMGWARVSNNIRYTASFVPPRTPPSIDANTIGQWNMSEGTGTIATNTGNCGGTAANCNGTITSGTWQRQWEDVSTPTQPTSVNFDGASTYVNAGSEATVDDLFLSDFTLDWWMKPGRFGSNNDCIWSKYVDANHYFSVTLDSNNNLGLYTSFSGGAYTKGIAHTMTIGKWYHVTMVWSASTNTPYFAVNGVWGAAQTGASGTYNSDASANLQLGALTTASRYYSGSLGWMRISSGARFVTNASFTPPSRTAPPTSDASTIRLFKMNEGGGTTITDYSANAQNGTLSNGTWNNSRSMDASAGEKIYAWGYEFGSNAANQGITQTVSGQTAGANYVVKPVIHYEPTARPRVRILDATNSDAEITHLDAPDQTTEKVTNGTFDSDTTGWATYNNGVISSEAGGVSGNRLKLLNSAAMVGRFYQVLQLQPYGAYRLNWWHKNGTTGHYLRMGTTYDGADIYNGAAVNDTDWAAKNVTFLAGASGTVYLAFSNTGSLNDYTYVDSISVTRLIDSKHPWTEPFTFELPTVSRNGVAVDSTSFKVQVINLNTSGTTYVHQVEVLPNLIDNPSVESGSGGPWIPSGWNNSGLTAGEMVQEVSDVHSGKSLRLVNATYLHSAQFINLSIADNKYIGFGGWLKNTSNMLTGLGYVDPQSTKGALWLYLSGTSTWSHSAKVGRIAGSEYLFLSAGNNNASGVVDDFYAVALSDVTLTITPASEANSAETSGLRVDGNDSNTQPITTITTTGGTISFKATPRHSFADAAKFGFANPVIADFYYDDNNGIKVYYLNSTTLRTAGMFNGTSVNADWTTPVLTAGTSYNFRITYQSGGNLSLYISDVLAATNSGVVAFVSTPSTAYFGLDHTGSNQYDLTVDTTGVSFSAAVNSTAPYYKFGAQSAKLINAGTTGEPYLTSVNAGSTSSHTLSAYVYDGTTGNIGGTVSNTVAQLVFNGSPQSATTYTDMGGGWWRLYYTDTPGLIETYASSNTDTDQGLYAAAANQWLGQGFKVNQSTTVSTVGLWLKKVGSGTPTTTYYRAEIQTDSSGKPSGTAVTNGTSACTAKTTSATYAFQSMSFATPPSLTSGTQYHLVLKPFTDNTCATAQWVADGTNYIAWGYDNSSSVYGNGDRSLYGGASWTAQTGTDHSFIVYSNNYAQNFGVWVPAGKTVYTDGVQLEGKAYNTTYADGTLGTGYTWAGTAHASISTRASTNLVYSNTNNINNEVSSISFWFKPTSNWGVDYVNQGTRSLAKFANSLNLQLSTSNSVVYISYSGLHMHAIPAMNQWRMLTFTYDGSSRCIYSNGNQVGCFGSGGYTNTKISIGSDGTDDTTASAVYSNFQIYSSVLSSSDVSNLYYSGLGSHSEQVVSTDRYTDGTPPVTVWHFDEGAGTTAYDSTIYQNTGTIANATWSTDSPSGLSPAKSLKFNGSSAKVTRAYSRDTELNLGTDPFSVSMWFKAPLGYPAIQKTLVTRYSSAGFKAYMTTSGTICFGIDDDSTWGPDDIICSANSYADGNWHYLQAVKSASSIALYLDATLKGTNSSLTATTSLSGGNPSLNVGVDSDGASNWWDGNIDEFKFYTTARTLDQAQVEYNDRAASSIKGVIARFGGGGAGNIADKGLVGQWKMDEGSGTTFNDSTINGNNASVNGTTTWGTGKFGTGGKFNGAASDYAYSDKANGLNGQQSFTISTWVNPTAVASEQTLVGRWNEKSAVDARSYRLYINSSGKACAQISSDGTANTLYTECSSNSLTAGAFSLVGATLEKLASGNLDLHVYINGTEGVTTVSGSPVTSIYAN